ncbi:inositol oxygenase [Balamuthia mandrillaris]
MGKHKEKKSDSVTDELHLTKEVHQFRNYGVNKYEERVRNNYRQNHVNQTYAFASEMKKKYSQLNTGIEMSIWEAAELLNDIVDDSDPDLGLPQIVHLLQTAEALRAQFPGEEYDWLHLTGFIHDLGKLLAHPRFPQCFNQPQWAVVGDTFPLGCPFSDSIVYREYFKENPDMNVSEYQQSENGIYSAGCGLENLLMSWGHDEYMYQVCVGNGCTLPPEGLYIIRFHSFYPYHQAGAYAQFTNETDHAMFPWIKVCFVFIFQLFYTLC